MLFGKAFDSFFLLFIDFLQIELMMLKSFSHKLVFYFWEISCQIFKFFTFFSRKSQNKNKIIQNEDIIPNDVKREDNFKDIELEFFNLLKKYSIKEVEKMNISYIKSFKLDNGRTAFKYPEFPLKYDDLPLNQLPEEKIYYLKTLFNNYKLIDLIKEEDDNIPYPHISLDDNNNTTSMKEKIIKLPYSCYLPRYIPINELTQSNFKQINQRYEVYVSKTKQIFKFGISVKMFRVISAHINQRNKENKSHNENIGVIFLMYRFYLSYKYLGDSIGNHMVDILQYSVYDKEKSLFYLYLPFETAEKYLRILYNLSWVAYDELLIDPRDTAEPEWFECDTFLEYIKLIHHYNKVYPYFQLFNPLEHSNLFSFYGYEFPGDPVVKELC